MGQRMNVGCLILAAELVRLCGTNDSSGCGAYYNFDNALVWDREIVTGVLTNSLKTKAMVEVNRAAREKALESILGEEVILSFDFLYSIKSEYDAVTVFLTSSNMLSVAESNGHRLWLEKYDININRYCNLQWDDIMGMLRNYNYVYPAGFDENLCYVFVSLGKSFEEGNKCFAMPIRWIGRDNIIESGLYDGNSESIEAFKVIAKIFRIIQLRVEAFMREIGGRESL